MKFNISNFLTVTIALLLIISANLYAIDRGFVIGPTNLVDKIGQTNGAPINFGFVFYDGEYIEAPYVVSRKGLSIYINDKLISYCKIHPKRKKYSLNEDPGFPGGVTSTSTYSEISKHNSKICTYLFDNYPENEAKEKMLEYYRQLPCVDNVTCNTNFLEGGHFYIKYINGEIIPINLFGHPFRKQVEQLSNELLEELLARKIEKARLYHEDRLAHGTTYFVQSKDSTFCLSGRKTEKNLRLAVEIIRSERIYDQKMELLRRMDILPPGGMDVLTPVVSNFQASAQFDTRLQKAIQNSKYKQRAFSDIPDEAPADSRKRKREEFVRKAREKRNN